MSMYGIYMYCELSIVVLYRIQCWVGSQSPVNKNVISTSKPVVVKFE